MTERGRRALIAVGCAALAAGLSACSVGPDFLRPQAEAGAGYTPEKLASTTEAGGVTGGAAQRFLAGTDVPGQWWTLFRSKPLNAMIAEALRANPDIDAAQATLRQARETGYADQGAFFPTVSGTVSNTRERTSGDSIGEPGFAPTFTVATASLSVTYAPDVFGGVRREVESAEAQAEYERFQLEATYLTLTSNVANSAVTLASLRDQIVATENIIKSESDQLDLMNQRFDLGAIAKSDVLNQEAALAQARATLPPLQKQLAQARNQLMAYLGRFPNQDKSESFALAALRLPDKLPVSLPSKLVEQRPDVRASEAQLHEASANIGVAIANQLPQFSLTASSGTTATSLGKLFSPDTAVWSLGQSVATTIFDGGALEHRKRAAEAAYDQAAAQYRRTVLNAFADVANALRALQADADTLKVDAVAERAASDSLDLTRQQYDSGAIDYVTLLTAQQTYHNAVVTRVRAQAARYSDTVALFQALGGGWWNRADVRPDSEGSPDRLALPPVQEITFSTLQ
jgi:NodT family efflux transporter outer membrane factor (OMF) lipoprotein